MTNPKLKLLYHKDDTIPALRIAVALKIAGVNLWMDKFDTQTDKEDPVDFDRKLVVLSDSHELPKTEAGLDTEQETLYFVLLKDFSENLDGADVIGDFREVKDEAGFEQEIQNIVDFFTSEAPNLVSSSPDKEEKYLWDTIARIETYFASSDFAFVENRVAKGALSFSTSDESDDDDKSVSSIGEAFRLTKTLVISGSGGSGKTTFLQEFALDIAKERLHHVNGALLPMMIDFSLEKWGEKETFLDLVHSYWKLDTPPESMMEDIIFLIDSFEDVPAHKKDGFVKWLSDNSDFNIILCGDGNTKVPLDWDRVNVTVDRGLVEAITKQFVGNDADDVLNTIYGTRKKDFAPLVYNLNVLRLLVGLINDSDDKKGPKTLGMLYQALTEFLWYRFSVFFGWVELDDVRSKIETLAFEMHHSDLTLSSNQLIDDPAVKALDKAGFLISNDDSLGFRYPFAKHYFAASYLFSMKPRKILGLIEEPSFFLGRRMSSVWDSVFVTLTGLAEEPSNIIMAIAEREPFLAAKCVASGISVDESVLNSLGEFYRHLLDEEENPSVLSASAEALADLGDIAAIPKIINVIRNLSDGGMLASQGLLDALAKFDSAALPGLIDLIGDPNTDYGTGFSAVMEVKRINEPVVIPDILMLLEQGNPHGRELSMVLDGFDIPSHMLLKMLESDNVDARRNAIFAFSKSATLDAVPVLLDLLDDNDLDIRMGSAMSLVHIGPETIPALLERVTPNNLARAELISELIEQMGENAKPFLIDSLSTPDHSKRAFIAQALGMLSWEDLSDIERKLFEGNTNERLGASWALGILGDEGGEDILINALESDEKELRMVSLSGLSRTQNSKTFQAITKLLQNTNTDTDEAQQALRTLLVSDDKEIIPGLIAVLHYQDLWDAVPHIISKLSSFKDDAIVPLYHVLIGEHDYLRMIASKTLEEIGESARSYLEEAKDKDKDLIHLAAMLALGGLDGDPDAALKTVLFNDMVASDARVAALTFLNHETNPERVAVLLDALNIDSWDIRYAALELSGELTGDEKEKLVEIATDNSLPVQKRIAATLGTLSNIGRSETGVFLNLLEDEVPALRLAAAIGLEKNMDEAFIPTLRASLNDKNIFVSEVISEALDASGSSVKQSSKKVSVQEEDLVNLFIGGER